MKTRQITLDEAIWVQQQIDNDPTANRNDLHTLYALQEELQRLMIIY